MEYMKGRGLECPEQLKRAQTTRDTSFGTYISQINQVAQDIEKVHKKGAREGERKSGRDQEAQDTS